MKTYNFAEQLSIGDRAERAIANHLRVLYFLRKASAKEQRQGIDFIGVHRRLGYQMSFEIKADEKAHKTGNCFIEIAALDGSAAGNWANTCSADLLIYVCVGLDEILFLCPQKLRLHLADWKAKYRAKPARNASYNTWGLCVPVPVVRSVAEGSAIVKIKN